MPGLLAFGAVCIIATVIFWYVELKYFLSNLHHVVNPHKHPFINWLQRVQSGFINVYRLFTYGKFFWMDLAATLSLTSFMGMGEGVTGGILGLFLSDAISVLLVVVMNKQRKINAASMAT